MIAKKLVEGSNQDWDVVLSALAYAAAQYVRAGGVECADKCKEAYNNIAKQTGLRTPLPMHDRSARL